MTGNDRSAKEFEDSRMLVAALKAERVSLQARLRTARKYRVNVHMQVEADILESQIEALTSKIDSAENLPEVPLGAAHNARCLADLVEQEYDFECQAGPLSGCCEWQDLRQCIAVMANYIDESQGGPQ